jgi:peptidoglycan/LPS O-acetylase OafA/YrhL
MTLGDGLRGRDNALNLVRLLLAGAVVLSHTRPVGGFGPDPTLGGRGLGSWAVAGFFAISGYLICASRERLPWKDFVVSRMLRIYPGYWLSLLAVAGVFAPVAAVTTGTDFDGSAALSFVLVNLVAPAQFAFGDALTRAAHPEAWNAPLWTLSPEMLCYTVAGVALTSMVVRRRTVLFSWAALVAVTASPLLLEAAHRLSTGPLLDFLHLLGFFTAGALAWALRDRITIRTPFMALSVAALCVVGLAHATNELAPLPLAYLVLAVGCVARPGFTRELDLSYGLYILSWPIQTTLYLMGVARLGWAAYCSLTFAIAVPVAYASWTCVEKPALGLRRRLRGPTRHDSLVPVGRAAPAPAAIAPGASQEA